MRPLPAPALLHTCHTQEHAWQGVASSERSAGITPARAQFGCLWSLLALVLLRLGIMPPPCTNGHGGSTHVAAMPVAAMQQGSAATLRALHLCVLVLGWGVHHSRFGQGCSWHEGSQAGQIRSVLLSCCDERMHLGQHKARLRISGQAAGCRVQGMHAPGAGTLPLLASVL